MIARLIEATIKVKFPTITLREDTISLNRNKMKNYTVPLSYRLPTIVTPAISRYRKRVRLKMIFQGFLNDEIIFDRVVTSWPVTT